MTDSLTIRKLGEQDRDAVTAIFVDAYYDQLAQLEEDRTKLFNIFQKTFLLEHYYGAFIDEELVGFFALSDEKERCMKIEKKNILENINGILGRIAYRVLRKEFEHKLKLKKPGYNIESVATSKKHQGKGIATKLMQYAMENNAYLELDVLDTNTRAYELYKRIGFNVYKEEDVPVLLRKIKGYRKRVFMNYERAF